MRKFPALIATAALASLLTACAGSLEEKSASANQPNQPANTQTAGAEAESQSIVVTGAYVDGQRVRDNRRAAPSAPPQVQALIKQGTSSANFAQEMPHLPGQYYDQGRDKFSDVEQNTFKAVDEEPVSTFSIDVDTASYALRARCSEPQCAAAAGGGADRGDGQLLPL